MSRPLNLEAVVRALQEIGLVVRDAGLLASALERPHTTLFGAEVYPSLAEKAGALVHAIAKYHPMIDGNKRSAWIVMNVFLEINGFDLQAPGDEAFRFMISVATDELLFGTICGWIEERISPIAP